jgi:hypothetical protein
MRTPQRWPKLPQDPEPRQKLVLDGFRQCAEFGLEFRMKEHCPRHPNNNALEGIWFQVHR